MYHSRPRVRFNLSVQACICVKNTNRLRDDKFGWDVAADVGPKSTLAAQGAPDSIEHGWLWYILTYLGFLTEPHVDASGWATWMEMLKGTKIWILMRRKGFASPTTWKSLVDFEEMTLEMSPDELVASYDMWAVVLSPGMQL
jgi:hypothetical protein